MTAAGYAGLFPKLHTMFPFSACVASSRPLTKGQVIQVLQIDPVVVVSLATFDTSICST